MAAVQGGNEVSLEINGGDFDRAGDKDLIGIIDENGVEMSNAGNIATVNAGTFDDLGVSKFFADDVVALVNEDGSIDALGEQEAKNQAEASVTTNGTVVYYASLDDANNAAAGVAGAVVTPIENTTPDGGNEGTAAPGVPEDSKESEKTSTPKTGDATPFAAVAFGLAALTAAGALVATRKVL